MSHEQAQAQVSGIVELIAALDVDFDRLAELRDADAQQRSVSSGTHRPQDLIPAFIDELRAADEAAYEQLTVNSAGVPSYVYDDGDDSDWWDSEDASMLLEELFEALNDSCGADMYFGAHCGNGSDFGFWLTEEAADELAELSAAAGEYESRDDVEEAINNDPLSIELRSAWAAVGTELEAVEYRVILCTGGPHVELQGDIGLHGEPTTVRVLYQDWFTGKAELIVTDGEHEALMRYVGQFYFGE